MSARWVPFNLSSLNKMNRFHWCTDNLALENGENYIYLHLVSGQDLVSLLRPRNKTVEAQKVTQQF